MWQKAISNAVSTGSAVYVGYQMGKDNAHQPQQPIQIVHEPEHKNDENNNHIELWVILAVIVFILLAILFKLVTAKRAVV